MLAQWKERGCGGGGGGLADGGGGGVVDRLNIRPADVLSRHIIVFGQKVHPAKLQLMRHIGAIQFVFTTSTSLKKKPIQLTFETARSVLMSETEKII